MQKTDFDIKGISFDRNDLKTIRLDDLRAGSISPVHLFYLLPGNRFILMLKAGDYIDSEFIARYQEKGVESFYCLEIATEDDVLKFHSWFKELSRSKSEENRIAARERIVKSFGRYYWRKTEVSFLSFVVACFQEFYFLPEDIVKDIQAKSVVLYSRALITSSFVVINSLVNGFDDYLFLKDLYNACFMLDYAFIETEDFNYFLIRACEEERKNPGTGLLWLESNSKSKKDRELYFNHPDISAEKANSYKDLFFNPEVIDLIALHHEKADGSGFPKGIAYSALSEADILLTFADHMVTYDNFIFAPGDGEKVVKNSFEELKKLQGISLKKSILIWEDIFNWAIRPSEQAGEVA